MASDKAPTEQRTAPSTEPSEKDSIPDGGSFEDLAEYLDKHPDAKVEVQAVTWRDRPIWKPGEPDFSDEELRRRISEIDEELDGSKKPR